jgi:hypothetical protein
MSSMSCRRRREKCRDVSVSRSCMRKGLVSWDWFVAERDISRFLCDFWIILRTEGVFALINALKRL